MPPTQTSGGALHTASNSGVSESVSHSLMAASSLSFDSVSRSIPLLQRRRRAPTQARLPQCRSGSRRPSWTSGWAVSAVLFLTAAYGQDTGHLATLCMCSACEVSHTLPYDKERIADPENTCLRNTAAYVNDAVHLPYIKGGERTRREYTAQQDDHEGSCACSGCSMNIPS